jgi:hypothetical protein
MNQISRSIGFCENITVDREKYLYFKYLLFFKIMF